MAAKSEIFRTKISNIRVNEKVYKYFSFHFHFCFYSHCKKELIDL